MGVEPTAARAVRPAADFEDREAHRDSYTPERTIAYNATPRYSSRFHSPDPNTRSSPLRRVILSASSRSRKSRA
jgi:hypothetical protein